MHIAGQSTKVTERNVGPRRLPPYWFDSRRLYFTLTHGAAYAACVDAMTIAASGVGLAKSALLGRLGTHVPHFVRDLFRHSALRARALAAPDAGAERATLPRFD